MKNSIFTLITLFFLFSNYNFGQNCLTGTDEPLGCLNDCLTWSGLGESFSADVPRVGMNCSSAGLSRWFKISASSTTISLSMERFNCNPNSEIYIQVFDSSLAPVSSCEKFTNNDFSTIITPTSIIVDQEYSVKVESNESIGCDFEIKLGGTNSNDITGLNSLNFIGDFQAVEGSISLGAFQNVNSINWDFVNGIGTIESGQGTGFMNYTKPRFEEADLELNLISDCGSAQTIPLIIPADESSCISNSDVFPGCDYNCGFFWTLDETFTPSTSTCSGGNTFSKWLKVIATQSTIRIESDRNNCDLNSEFNIQLFDNQQNPLDTCTTFRNDNFSSQEATFTDLVIGNEYSILIESNTAIGCDFRLEFSGIEAERLNRIRAIGVFANSGLRIDSASVEPVIGATSYQWEIIGNNASIIGGQGTPNITFSNPSNGSFRLSVLPISICKIGSRVSRTIMPTDPNTLNIRPCCEAPNIPNGCSEAGTTQANSCMICNLAGIYSGNNGPYPAIGDFSCGIPHNSAYVSVIADGSGIISATMLTDLRTCINNPVTGLQLILRDQLGDELDCAFIGAVPNSNPINASGLVPGALYTFQIDGLDGDACDYTLITSGVINGTSPDPPGPIKMDPDTVLCPGANVCFEIDPVINASEYQWIVPQNIRITSGGGPLDIFVCGIVENPGGGVVTVTPSNFCFEGVQSLIPIVSLPIPPSIWPPILVCQSDMPFDTTLNGQVFSFDQFGAHELNLPTAIGCDSIIGVSIIPLIQIPHIIDTTILAGTCFTIEDSCYSRGVHTIVLNDLTQANGCDSTVILVIEFDSTVVLTSDFSVDMTNICIEETVTFTYTGNASPNANYDWDFGNATIISGVGAGPYVVRFSDIGDFSVSLSVIENGVASSLTTNVISVYPALLPLSLTCNSTIDEVIYTWMDDPNVSTYSFNITTGQTGIQDGNSFIISNLNPNEVVTMEVTAESSFGCANSSDIQTCTAQDCPVVNVTIDAVPAICLTTNAIPIQLTGQAGNNSGIFEWTGVGVNSNGEFDPNIVGPGSHQVTLNYKEGNCVYSSTQIITIESSPGLNATVNSPIWILGGSGSIDLNIRNGLPPYDIDFGPNITQLDSLLPGQYQITAIDQNGCTTSENFVITNGTYSTSPIHIICSGDVQPLTVSPETGATFSWTPNLRLSCNDCPSPLSNPRRSTQYTVTATLPDGRSESQIVTVIVLPSIVCNGISPNDDEVFTKLLSDFDIQKIGENDLVEIDKRILDYYSKKEIKIAPNPTDGIVNILTPANVESVDVFDFSGKQVMTAFEKEIDLSHLAKGV